MLKIRAHLERLVRPIRYDLAAAHVEYALDALERVPRIEADVNEALEHCRAAREFMRELDAKAPRG